MGSSAPKTPRFTLISRVLLGSIACGGCAQVAPLGPAEPTAAWTTAGYARGSESGTGGTRDERTASRSHPSRERALLASADVPASPVRSDGGATSHPYQAEVPPLAANAAASRYAELSDRECESRIVKLSLPAARATTKTSGVASPMRLTGSLHGVRFVTPGASSPFGVVDCRMVLALNDFAEALAAANVVSVRIDNFYRPHAHLPGKKKASQHASALASDIDTLTLADGRTLSVADDWHAAIGSTSCGPDAVLDEPTPEAIELRNIVCDVARRGIFHHMLTPSFNAEHRTHLHFDIKRGEKRQSVR